MSGKAYTMREMKMIVEYIVEHKTYKDIKGRKMWVDFANSQMTKRTWQSLKETFLKRILPDIHNPYYKLSMEQIRSFREGKDIEAREKNKLEIINIEGDSNSNDIKAEADQAANEKPSSSHDDNGKVNAGEDVTCSKIKSRDRDSVDTVIIPTCYETAEDVLRALESPNNQTDNNAQPIKVNKPIKSLRDLITYSEPLTPILQEVLNDFATDGDSDSSELKMQIVETVYDSDPQIVNKVTPDENTEVVNSEPNVSNEEPPIEIVDSEDVINKDKDEVTNENSLEKSDDFIEPKVMSLKLRKRKGAYEIDTGKSKKTSKLEEKNKTETAETVSEICGTTINEADKKQDEVVPAIPDKTTSTLSNSADTILPNNQEALEKSEKFESKDKENEIVISKSKHVKSKSSDDKSNKRKRAVSQDVATASKFKSYLGSQTLTDGKAISDNDTSKKILKSKSTVSIKKSKQHNTTDSKPHNNAKEVNKDAKNDTNPPNNKLESKTSTQLSQLNPCLKSVSLFAEQFNSVSYIESDSEHELVTSGNKDKSNKRAHNNVAKTINDVVILKSHSESESEINESSQMRNKEPHPRITKSQTNKILANVFGFSSGAVGTKRKKSTSHKKNYTYRFPRQHDSSAESSEWTSESDSEVYVSPSRGRRNRHARKYLKPHSARILSLEEEGGLFVMYGKKIYPIVKDGKTVKNYLTYLPDSEDEEESFWKQKYVEERFRVDELKKLVEQRQIKHAKEKSPILQTNSLRNMSITRGQKSPASKVRNKEDAEIPVSVPLSGSNKEVNETGKTLKITFAKNNQEVHLEGHWSNIHPVLAEVVQIFNKDTEIQKESIPNGNAETVRLLSDTSSDKSVALVPIVVDPEVHEKVNKLETEIFKEIEERDKEEQSETKEPTDANINTRKRALRNKKSSSNQLTVAQSTTPRSRSPKRMKNSDASGQEAEAKKTVNEQELSEKKTAPKSPGKKVSKTEQKSMGKKVSKHEQESDGNKTSKTEQKLSTDKTKTKQPSVEEKPTDKSVKKDAKAVEQKSSDDVKETLTIEAANSLTGVLTKRRTRTPVKGVKDAETPSKVNTRIKKTKTVSETAPSPAPEDEEEIRYMFPPETKAVKTAKSTHSVGKTKENKRTTEEAKILAKPNFAANSESTQGYQDSDVSPPKASTRRKRKLSLSTALAKIKHRSYRNTRKSYPIITNDISSDSNSSYHIVVRPASDSSLKSEAYRSESYQILLPQAKNVFRPLGKIEEDHTDGRVERNLKSMAILNGFKNTLDVGNDFVSPSTVTTDGNSSNVSLPLSPELSIVEKLSISREQLNNVENHPTLNEIQANYMPGEESRSKYMMSHVDVSMPLMQQECNLRHSFRKHRGNKRNLQTFNDIKQNKLPESLSNEMNTTTEDDASLSESLDTRLKNLLLESAKKISLPTSEENNNEVKDIQTKQSGKRCSTPRRKKDVQKKKLKITEAVVEECMESCSYGGRKSCPPAIQVIITDENMASKKNVDTNSIDSGKDNDKVKIKRKKDIIKVKILRPKSKSKKKTEVSNKAKDFSMHNDSGINETESVISNIACNDSIDLIHNHSETCLQANECISDSIEFIDTSAKSIISLNTTDSMPLGEKLSQNHYIFKDCEDMAPELFCHNAQDCACVKHVQELSKTNTNHTEDTVYHSPILSETSLITEDLSDESPQSRATKWYLLSEDDTGTANANVVAKSSTNSSFGSSLKQIFPITCAVPDLSTITETSENSRKPTIETDSSSRLELDSQDMFDNIHEF